MHNDGHQQPHHHIADGQVLGAAGGDAAEQRAGAVGQRGHDDQREVAQVAWGGGNGVRGSGSVIDVGVGCGFIVLGCNLAVVLVINGRDL